MSHHYEEGNPPSTRNIPAQKPVCETLATNEAADTFKIILDALKHLSVNERTRVLSAARVFYGI